MKIIFFAHPKFANVRSIDRYTYWLADGMKARGHEVEIWAPKPAFHNLPFPENMKKWPGYMDQYIVFPMSVKGKISKLPKDTLFVLSDHALGPWVTLVADKMHVIHCHDLLAQQSAMGLVPENPTGWSGQQYQQYIRSGFSKGKNFISISNKTQSDLHEILGSAPQISEVVYNGLALDFLSNIDITLTRIELGKDIHADFSKGYILHVGGNTWYKNKKGVVEMYLAWRKKSQLKLPLLMIGDLPEESIKRAAEHSDYKNDIYFLKGMSDTFLKKAYAAATVFLFPSLAEGFGWPIAEAMASGCPVITTNEAPMNEVAANACIYINRRPLDVEAAARWAMDSADTLERAVNMSSSERDQLVRAGTLNVKRFDSDKALDEIERIYKKVAMHPTVPNHS
ncbi:glycosyltransferase [Dyadobacter sp. CY327]|uniref:glycosyltransferase n=1 Tax=Dyadobacter sp. CY327 TaxID=2907301 RepID=UPI001F29CEEC|nr:glycosyltransferase [Dyadobacter sp. CY327]MCE7071026.1 glycosyltransferase [Dyadobacter sp. CY327]